MFNFVDVPMYLTLTDKVKMGTVGRLKSAIGALLYVPKFLGDKKLLARKLAEQREFVQYFERSVERNIEAILLDIRAYLRESPGTPDDIDVLITPLVMDFDVLLKEENPEQFGKEPSVREQFARIVAAIDSHVVKSIPNCRVCPFVGFDLRKLEQSDKDRLAGFRGFWDSHSGLGAADVKSLVSGRLLGIKLYPPIGFNPCPTHLPARYREFYGWCCANDIPLTTHCQTGSFAAGKEKIRLDEYTTPENWRRLLRHPEFKTLRINFAHFGGETGADDMFEPFRIDRDSWTYILIELLKEYPNTFADIAAYDYSKREHRNNLLAIFEKDAAGDFGPGHRLADKLLWGSDVPMVISDKSYRSGHSVGGSSEYRHYIRGFLDTIGASKVLSPDEKTTIVDNLTEKNPKKFLRIG
jgi:predicted TIM-barrel fold metal-dependent hydrolase